MEDKIDKENRKLATYLNEDLDYVEAGLKALEENKMELEVKENISLEEGQHKGSITKVEYRNKPEFKYEYVDVFVKPDGKEFEIKYGCPKYLSEDSKLGKLLVLFGADVKPKTKIDPDKFLVGKKVTFVSVNESKDDKTYVRIVSLKPQ